MPIDLRELWRYRELFYIFTWRDIKVRYKQTLLGILWALLQPFFLMVVFSLFFGGLAKIPSDGIPYPIFVYAGLLFWNYFAAALTNSGNSLIDNENLIKKIYFPRLILPLTPAITPLIDFGIALFIYGGLFWYYHFTPTLLGIILLPVLILISFLSAAGLGIFLSSINVRYRDIRFIIPFLIQSLFFLTPVIYPTSLVPEKAQWLLALNPMTGVIDAARAGLIGQSSIDFRLLAVSAVLAVSLFILGVYVFRRTEGIFSDVA